MKTKTNAKFYSLKISLLVTAATLALRLANAQCDPPPSGLVGWWPGEGGATDIVGNNNGTLVGGVGFSSGEIGQAFRLDGTNSYIQIPDSAALKPANVTVEAWVRFDSLFTSHSSSPLSDSIGLEYIVFKKNTRSIQFEGYTLFKGTSAGEMHNFGFLVSSASGVQKGVGSTTQVVTGQFYHVVGTYDGNAVRIYVNGVLEASIAANFPLDYGTRPVFIGTSGETIFDGKFAGLIDEVSIYSRALSASEIAAIYAAGSSGKCNKPIITSQPQSQIGYWGQSASFSVTAFPPPLNYQWQSNGVAISGATNQTLTLTNLQNSFAAGYTVVVSNPYGSVTSAPPANLTINPAGVAIALYPGVKIDGVVGLTYGIQYSTDLANTNGWIGVTNLTFTQPTEIWYDSIPASMAQRFYRVLQGPIPIP